MKYKIIALDIDGTLKGDSSLMSPYMTGILEECVARGAAVSVATGRSLKSALIFLKQAPMIETIVLRKGKRMFGKLSYPITMYHYPLIYFPKEK